MYAIYGHIYHQYVPNVSIYTSTMDPMGIRLCHHDIEGVLLCTLLISMAYASCRTKRMARDELVEHMRVDVSEGE